jgi:meiotically up-regulated gene 157 (Mug157) protein
LGGVRRCYPNTVETTTELPDDGTTFVFTGDIPACGCATRRRRSGRMLRSLAYVAIALVAPALGG